MVIVWDMKTGNRMRTIRFDAPVVSATLHPRNSKIIVVVLHNRPGATLVDLREDFQGRFELEVAQQEDIDASHRPSEPTNTKKRK